MYSDPKRVQYVETTARIGFELVDCKTTCTFEPWLYKGSSLTYYEVGDGGQFASWRLLQWFDMSCDFIGTRGFICSRLYKHISYVDCSGKDGSGRGSEFGVLPSMFSKAYSKNFYLQILDTVNVAFQFALKAEASFANSFTSGFPFDITAAIVISMLTVRIPEGTKCYKCWSSTHLAD